MGDGGETILILAAAFVTGSIMTRIYQCVDVVVPGESQS